MYGGINNLQVVMALAHFGAQRQGVDFFDVGTVHVLADDLNQVRITFKLDFAHIGNGIDVLNDVHVMGSDHLCTVVPVGLVAVVDFGIVRCCDVHTALATQAADGITYLGRGTRTFKQIHFNAVGTEDIGDCLGKQTAVVAHVMANDNRNLVPILECLVQIVGKALSGATHGVDVHAVAACTHDAAQASSTELQGLVERLDQFSLVLGVKHCLHLGARLLVIALAQPHLGLCGHVL